MSQPNEFDNGYNRRQWIVLATAALAGCGGGEGLASLPGTGGTGIFAQGPISGFGSVIVNGTKYDDYSALVQINGSPAATTDLRLGMVAEVQGTRDAASALGTAGRIDVWSIAQGPIVSVQAGQLTVAGMVVQLDSATVLEGISTGSGLSNGMQVAVWGLQAGADGARWTATRVAVVSNPTGTVVSTGLVSASASQHKLNGLPMAGQLSTSLAPGQMVRVQGATLSDASLRVDAYRVLGLQSGATPSSELELEGVVSQVLSPTRFMLGNQEVDTSTAIMSTTTPVLAVSQRVEVRGSMVGQILKAKAVDVQSVQKLEKVELDAKIEVFTSLASFVVRGQRCDATKASISKGQGSDLKVGVRVKLEGTKAGDVVLVTSMEINT